MSIGLFLGIVFVLSQQMLILFAILLEQSNVPNQATEDTQSYLSIAAFSFLLFLSLATFATFLAVFRDDVISKMLLFYFS